MTTAEKLHQQGVREGHERGVREVREGLERSLRTLLERRFGDLPPAFAARLRGAEVDALLRATERVLTAASLDEVLEG